MSGIVCNTGPLIALERVGLLHLFGSLFGHVMIPAIVEREFLAGQPVGTSFFEARASGKIQVATVEIARDIYGRRTLGTVRVLLEAKQGGLIDAIRQPLESIREHGYRIHEDIVQAALRQAGEAL